MFFAPRNVCKVNAPASPSIENPLKRLDEVRDQAAWVLLGEPGAGKTEAFKREAEATDGRHLSIAEFIDTDVIGDPQGRTLFLDGLDEIRAGSGDESILYRIRAKLKHLGNPPFRIACRAADWFGSTDRDDIKGASLDGEITVLLLEPLAKGDILTILRENHGINDPDAFVEKAQRRGVDNMLDNPQTLGLLANAIRDDQWPSTRQETFQLACEKLVEEKNKRHRNKRRGHPESTEKLLDAAGHLCAVLLLSDKTGVALDPDQANDRFPYLDAYTPPERSTAHEAIRRLFRLEKEECFVPSHRSIAEYLAGRWLATHIDRYGLPLGRVLNLMLGRDGRTVAGLRGLYGWLALHCQAARTRMIEADCLTIVLYGDAKPLPIEDKRQILTGLQREAKRYAGFRGDTSSAHHAFGALADPELSDDFIAVLESPERGEAAQTFAHCILDILAGGDAVSGLAETVKNVFLDDSRWSMVRKSALQVWLKFQTTAQEALTLLDYITDGNVRDTDDELAGQLLQHLYPKHIAPENLLHYLHIPKERHSMGFYFWFWEYELPKIAPEPHLPTLLDQLAARSDLILSEIEQFRLKQMVSTLLARGILIHGESVTDERLFVWLGIGIDKYGSIHREKTGRKQIAGWFEAHSQRYKALLLLCYKLAGDCENPGYSIHTCSDRLHGAAVPEEIGLWHLDQVSLTDNDRLAQAHLSEAVNTLIYKRGSSGLSLEKIEAWADFQPERKDWLKPLLISEIADWGRENVASKRDRDQERIENKRERTVQVSKHIEAIQSGCASVALMHQLADTWKNLYTDIYGETLSERFNGYSENGQELLAAAESGFSLCLERSDLPTVGEIINLAIDQREHLIRQPCLIGMELRWRQGLSAIHSIPDDTLRQMLAFQITYGVDTPDWFTYLVTDRPNLVAEVLIDCASAALKSKLEYIDFIYPLENDPNYHAVATRAVPALLQHFPVRPKASKLRYLEHLLKAALRYHMDQLPSLVKKKMALKSMDVTQKVYWLTAGMLVDPEQYEEVLWQYIGNSWVRATHLSGFLSADFNELSMGYTLSARATGRLIEWLMPHAELEYPRGGGTVTNSMRRGEHIRTLVSRLSASATEEAANEIERLLALPSLEKLKFTLENARHQLQLKQRENEFNFLSLPDVTRVLANKAPASVPDLAALALDHLDGIAQEIHQENDDGFRAYWNIEKKTHTGKREENYCRDDLLRRLRARLDPLGVECQPEGDYSNDKRADIRLSYHNQFELPIEVKRDDNKTLWSALHTQLIGQYSIAPRAAGHGIYLVLWFGKGDISTALYSGKKPRSPEELKKRLEAQLSSSEQRQIFVRVLDVSWPANKLLK